MADEPVRWRGPEGTRRPVAGKARVSAWAVRGVVAQRREVFAHSTSMDGSPDASDVAMSAWVSCRHLSGITVFGVPKWGIRAHPPLQLVGLEGLGTSQAHGAPVRPVQLISSSSRNLVAGLQRAPW